MVRDAWLVLAKDLRIELRRLDGIFAMVFLAAVVVFVLAIALGAVLDVGGAAAPDPADAGLDRTQAILRAVGPGVLWVAGLLAGTVGLGRLLERERRHGGWSALLLAPISRTALFLGKSGALCALLLITDVVLVPLVALLYGVPFFDRLGALALLLLSGAAGYSMVATLLGAVALRARTGELLLGAVLYPLVVPLLVGGIMGTEVLLGGGGMAELRPWLGLVLVTDALFLVAGLWLFESLAAE